MPAAGPSPISGLFEYALRQVIAIVGSVYNTPTTPLVDEMGNAITVPFVTEYSMDKVGPIVVYTSITPGPLGLGNNYGLQQPTVDGTQWRFQARSPGCKVTFGIYTANEASRRYLADYLVWGVVSAYAITTNGLILQSYILRELRNRNMHPILDNLFDPIEYPQPILSDPRPFGLPYLSMVRMNFNLQVGWYQSSTGTGVGPITLANTSEIAPDTNYEVVIPIMAPIPQLT
jgi:hypothetical protein